MKPSILTVSGLVILLGLMFNGAAFAQGARVGGQDTMMVIDENQKPEDIVNQIHLPANEPRAGLENAGEGTAAGHQFRDRKRDGSQLNGQECDRDQVMERIRDRDQVMDQTREERRDQLRDHAADQDGQQQGWGQDHGHAGGNGNRR